MQPATFELLRGAPFYVNWMKKGTPQGSRALVRIEVYRMPRSSGWELIQVLCTLALSYQASMRDAAPLCLLFPRA